MTFHAEVLTVIVEQLGRERTRTDTRGVRLDDTQHVIEISRADTAAAGRTAGSGVGRGDIRIGTVVDIEQRTLCPLEHHAATLATQRMQCTWHILDHRLDLLSVCQRLVQHLLIVDGIELEIML